ncbi:MAG: hypothetical protein ACTHJW_18525 [Streptosporangiaceae bacterium]
MPARAAAAADGRGAGRDELIGKGGAVAGRDATVRVGVIGARIMGADDVRTIQRFVSGASVTMLACSELASGDDPR